MFRQRILPFIVWAFYRLFSATWRIRIFEPADFKLNLENRNAAILALWHGDELVMISQGRRYRASTMTSTSADGTLMDTVLRKLGFATSRGSSTRGGSTGLKGLLRTVQNGFNPCVTVDGPTGPLHKAKPGIFEISKLTGAPIFPVGVAASKKIVFKKSWNQAYLPYPFSVVCISWGSALPAVSKAEDPRDPKLAQRLENALQSAHQEAANSLQRLGRGATV